MEKQRLNIYKILKHLLTIFNQLMTSKIIWMIIIQLRKEKLLKVFEDMIAGIESNIKLKYIAIDLVLTGQIARKPY